MRSMTVREANQNFSKLINLVERGETITISKHGRAVATVAPTTNDKTQDPKWQAAYAEMVDHYSTVDRSGPPLGPITEEDKYGEADL